MIGQVISHYKILEKVGQGGMGVVYKAEDTTLDRLVALKFLPPALQAGEAEKARFMQEAKAAAALNHPNICSVIAIDESDGQMFIVMEFVDGQTLRDREASINQGKAVDIGIQIAEGLSAAHEKGIVHRDIKPENIMVRKDGIVQIMDFGLAKLRANNSKITRLTKEGSTVGTAGYMSPEQVQGQEADHRSDIFSLGVLLYELFTGELPFKGVHETALMYEIVNVDPVPMRTIKSDIAPELDRIVLECLQKEPDERYNSTKDVAKDLKRFKRESSRQRVSRITASRPSIKVERKENGDSLPTQAWPPYLGYALSAILAVIVVLLLVNPRGGEVAPSRPVMRFSVELPPDAMLRGIATGNGIAVSPDGRNFAYRARGATGGQVYLHKMDQLTSQPVAGSEQGDDISFSPDGQWLAFSGSRQSLIKVSLSGGAPEVLCPIQTQTRGVHWAPDNRVYFGLVNDAIHRVSSAGGTPEAVTTLDSAAGEISHRFPQILPDGNTILFTIKKSDITTFDEAVIVAQRLDNGERKVVVRGGSYAKFIPTGFLMYMRENSVLAVPFDPERVEVQGAPVEIESGGWFFPGAGNAHIDFSTNGIMVFAPSGSQGGTHTSLGWMDRNGTITPLYDSLRPYTSAVISPDGQKLALGINAANNDIWIYHIPRRVLSRLTFGGGNNGDPIWSPDGQYVVYAAEKGKSQNIFRKSWDGSREEERLTTSPNTQTPVSFSPDGKTLSFVEKGDIWVVDIEGDRKPRPFIHTSAQESDGMISPDGRWMAYSSNESGKHEVYITSFPGHQGRWQVSNGGGVAPLWTSKGKELVFFNGSSVMLVDILESGTMFDFSVPRKLCEEPPGVNSLDISSDGKKILVGITQTQRMTLPRVEVVTEWFDVVRSKFSKSNN